MGSQFTNTQNNKNFLILQGMATPFFYELGTSIKKKGYNVVRINFCGGDLLFGKYFINEPQYKSINYRKNTDNLLSFYQSIYKKYNISDIILFGDTRPIHVIAIKLAKKLKIRVHVYEEGYFRPNWVTLDKGGVNANSCLMNNSQWFINQYNKIVSCVSSEKVGGGLLIRAWHDIRYNFATLIFRFYFPFYSSHRPDSFFSEYKGFIRRIPSVYIYYTMSSNKLIRRIVSSSKKYFFFPLQQAADSQIRIHSPYKNIIEVIDLIIDSFVRNAPENSFLIIKNHPLDTWITNYSKHINKVLRLRNIPKERIIYLESGDIVPLLKNTSGTIVVNSTVGMSALSLDSPVIVLGKSIYDLSGLTFQGSLDEFWEGAAPPDSNFFEIFKKVVFAKTQINGSFYNKKGIEMTVKNSLHHLL